MAARASASEGGSWADAEADDAEAGPSQGPGPDPAAEQNYLLRLLDRESPALYEQMLPSMETVTLAVRDVLYAPGVPMSHVYFPQTSVCSIVKVMADGRKVEVGTVGNEGMTGLPILFGADETSVECFVQVPGVAKRLSTAALRQAAVVDSPLHAILQRYVHYLFNQTAQLVACNRLHPVEQRCARWLLMTHDRVAGTDTFPLTHEFLAIMLGVRRAGVSVAAEALRRAGVIRYSRGRITVTDRPGLEAATCECYRMDRAEFDQRLGGGLGGSGVLGEAQ